MQHVGVLLARCNLLHWSSRPADGRLRQPSSTAAAELVVQGGSVLGMSDQPAPLPSRSQIKKLGSRLRKLNPPTVEDLELLEEVRASHGQVLDQAMRTLLEQELPSTGRLKTTATIIEKLRRNPSMGLLTM
jgi:hypothetical protein